MSDSLGQTLASQTLSLAVRPEDAEGDPADRADAAPTPTPPAAPGEPPNVGEVLETLAAALSATLDPARVRAADAAARRAPEEPLLDRLARAGEAVGLRIVGLEITPDRICSLRNHELPLCCEGTRGEPLLVLEVRARRARIRLPDGDRWVSAQRLAELLGLPQPQAAATVAAAELALPLTGDTAAHGEDDHDHGAHDGHGHGGHGFHLSRVAKLLKLEKGDLGVLLVYAVFIGLTSLAVPVAVQALVNTVSFTTLLQPLVVLVLMVLACLAFSGVLRAMQALVVEHIQERLFVRAATEFAYRLPRIRVDAFDKVHPPEKVNRFFDVLTAQKTLAGLLTEGLLVALTAVMGLLLLAFYHPFLLAFDVVLIAAVVFIVWGLGRRAVPTSLEESAAKYEVVAWLQDVARSPLAFRLNQGAALERADDLARRYLLARRSHFRVLYRQIVASLGLQALASAGLLAVGGVLVIKQQLTLGQLVAAELVVSSVVSGVTKLGKHLESYYDLATALEKLGSVTDLPLERDDGVRALSTAGPARLELAGVAFSHRPGKPVLEGVSLAAEPAQKVALFGEHGSGKSTVADLIYGLREPQKGSILLDGVDLRELSLQELRRHVALVREVEIFEGTVYDNVAMGRPEVAPEDVHRALAAVGLGDEVARLRGGVKTRLLTGGKPLSLGQAQRLMLARALAGRPRLLVVDGLLDGLDAATLVALEERLSSVCSSTTLLVMTSVRAVADWCDDVVRVSRAERRAAASADAHQPAGGAA